jgi:glycosyltransferase involved in cell wall biosynthesis
MDRTIFGSQEHWATENSVAALADAIASAAAGRLRDMGLAAARNVRVHYAWPAVFGELFRLYDGVRVGFSRS